MSIIRNQLPAAIRRRYMPKQSPREVRVELAALGRL